MRPTVTIVNFYILSYSKASWHTNAVEITQNSYPAAINFTELGNRKNPYKIYYFEKCRFSDNRPNRLSINIQLFVQGLMDYGPLVPYNQAKYAFAHHVKSDEIRAQLISATLRSSEGFFYTLQLSVEQLPLWKNLTLLALSVNSWDVSSQTRCRGNAPKNRPEKKLSTKRFKYPSMFIRRTFDFHHEIVAPACGNDAYLDEIGQRWVDELLTPWCAADCLTWTTRPLLFDYRVHLSTHSATVTGGSVRLPVNSSHDQLVTRSTRHNSSYMHFLNGKLGLCLMWAIF